MKDTSKRSSKDIRRQHNADLVRRMRSGDSLTSFDSKASWYPPRPVIKKDQREIERVYNATASDDAPASRKPSKDGLRVLTLSSAADVDGDSPKKPLGEAS